MADLRIGPCSSNRNGPNLSACLVRKTFTVCRGRTATQHHARRRHVVRPRSFHHMRLSRWPIGRAWHWNWQSRARHGCGARYLCTFGRVGDRVYRGQNTRRGLARIPRTIISSEGLRVAIIGSVLASKQRGGNILAGCSYQRIESKGRAVLPRFASTIQFDRCPEQSIGDAFPRCPVRFQWYALEHLRSVCSFEPGETLQIREHDRYMAQPLCRRVVRLLGSPVCH
jgi:hypothetical protein